MFYPDEAPLCATQSLTEFFDYCCVHIVDIRDHLPFLREQASHAATTIEIGVGMGPSSSALLMGGTQLWSVDITAYPPADHLQTFVGDQWVRVIDESLNVVDDAPNDVDMLFIDSGHVYDLTYAELDAYCPKVKPGGVVFLHDTVTWVNDVWRAVVDWSGRNGCQATTDNRGSGLGFIQL